MASFVTLLINVRSETPTSFFLVVSKAAFLMLGLELPDAAARPPPGLAALSPFGLLLIPCEGVWISCPPKLMYLEASANSPCRIFPLPANYCFRMRPAHRLLLPMCEEASDQLWYWRRLPGYATGSHQEIRVVVRGSEYLFVQRCLRIVRGSTETVRFSGVGISSPRPPTFLKAKLTQVEPNSASST